ncbi:ThiF family adenylyltransferase [Streptomyces antimicrobicus]|uniref:ThiF family adenylyltransferase n=1 Tax=Streptomyces antimicrobicus TaxID=2883108 RepID=A0ABS8B2M5_9ACTN|nr:ThiF family adenylyltransferase [Streptomyces antimicrobicus]MCB5178833.1 ThiF family adenylyltransferase [Streptomyces antimicrobicus]
MLPVHVFDYVIDQVGTDIGRSRPEQGGALLGLRGRDVLTAFIHDAHAHVTHVEYSNTAWLLDEIARREEAGPERFKGIVHSHPAGMPHPSRQDHHEYGRALDSVPELGRYIAPIVTHDLRGPLKQHELLTDAARVSFFSAAWSAQGVRLDPVRPVVVPLAAALRQAGLPWSAELARTSVIGGVAGVSAALPWEGVPGGPRQHLFVTPDFPFAAPLLLEASGYDGELSVRELVWDHRVPELDRLAHALREAAPRGGAGTQARSRTPTRSRAQAGSGAQSGSQEQAPAPAARPSMEPYEPPKPPDTHDSAPAAGHWSHESASPHLTQDLAQDGAQQVRPAARRPGATRRLALRIGIGRSRAVREGLFARTHGLLSPTLADAHILLVGVGSVGSYLADVLVRSGVGRLTLVDPDRVEPANLGRALFGIEDIGGNKARMTARRLRGINRKLAVRVQGREVAALDSHTWLQLISGADLVIAATDDNQAQQRLNHLSYFVGRPAVFVGLYEGAAGGEIVFTTPGSPCWSCATGGVREVLGELGHQPRTDYGTGRTYAVPGLLPDIQHVAAAAAKVSLALLHGPAEPERIGGFLTMPLRERLSMVQFAMEPDHWFFPMVLGQVPGQHAFQSVWLRTGSRPECPVCGTPALRSDPRDHAVRGTDADITRAQKAAYAARRQAGTRP